MPEQSSVMIMAYKPKKQSTANRGKYLEDWVENANQFYNARNMAVITKIPTPWKVQRNFKPYTKQYEISYAYPEKKSTVDFGGTAQSRSIWFDVKVTKQASNFPLRNIHQHQLDYLKQVHDQGGKAFILIHSEHLKKTWLLWITDLLHFISTETRKSLTWAWLDEHCQVIEAQIAETGESILDYLPAVFQEEK